MWKHCPANEIRNPLKSEVERKYWPRLCDITICSLQLMGIFLPPQNLQLHSWDGTVCKRIVVWCRDQVYGISSCLAGDQYPLRSIWETWRYSRRIVLSDIHEKSWSHGDGPEASRSIESHQMMWVRAKRLNLSSSIWRKRPTIMDFENYQFPMDAII